MKHSKISGSTDGAHAADAETPSIGRRRLLALSTAMSTIALAGCDWFGSSVQVDPSAAAPEGPSVGSPAPGAAPPPANAAPAPTSPAPSPAPGSSTPAWSPQPSFVAGSQVPFDLAATLPAGIVRGGLFSIDPTGASLPSGMTLTSAGLLYAGTARVGTTSGVIFRYAEPA